MFIRSNTKGYAIIVIAMHRDKYLLLVLFILYYALCVILGLMIRVK
jgi:hypothetical protein